MASIEKVGYDQSHFYVWQSPDNVLSIHLSLKVVEDLTAEYFRAAEEGLLSDLRGVLLGRSTLSPHPATFVEHFVLLPSATGENQGMGSGYDEELMEMVCRLHQGVERGRNAIGLFRCQRDGGLILSNRDLKIANRLFSEPDDVMLLVRFTHFGESEAAFFYRRNGKIRRPDMDHVFPFDAAKLSRRKASAQKQDDHLAMDWLGASAPIVPATAAKGGVRWWQLLPTAALFTLGTIVAQNGIQVPGRASSTPAAAAPNYEAPLGLRVTSSPHQLQIRWNHDAKAIRAAEKGEIKIAEGDVVVTEIIPIDRRQLLNGYVAYTPLTDDVSIRMDVKAPDGTTTTESIRAVANTGTR